MLITSTLQLVGPLNVLKLANQGILHGISMMMSEFLFSTYELWPRTLAYQVLHLATSRKNPTAGNFHIHSTHFYFIRSMQKLTKFVRSFLEDSSNSRNERRSRIAEFNRAKHLCILAKNLHTNQRLGTTLANKATLGVVPKSSFDTNPGDPWRNHAWARLAFLQVTNK